MPRYRVEIDGSPVTGAAASPGFVVDTSDGQTAWKYGTNAKEVAHEVAADYCDSGSVRAINEDDPADRSTIHRR